MFAVFSLQEGVHSHSGQRADGGKLCLADQDSSLLETQVNLSALRDLPVQFKKNVATDKAVKTSVCRINYEVVTYLVLDD